MRELRIEKGECLADVLRPGTPQVIATVVGSELIALLRKRAGHAPKRQAARRGRGVRQALRRRARTGAERQAREQPRGQVAALSQCPTRTDGSIRASALSAVTWPVLSMSCLV